MGATCAAEQVQGEVERGGAAKGDTHEFVPSLLSSTTCCARQHSGDEFDTSVRKQVIEELDGTEEQDFVATIERCRPEASPPTQRFDNRDTVDDAEWEAMQAAARTFVGLPDDDPKPPRSVVASNAADKRASRSVEEEKVAAPSTREREVWEQGEEYWLPDVDNTLEDPEMVAERERDDILEAVRQTAKPLYTVPEHLRSDKEVVLAAIGNEGGYCWDYISSQELRERDRDVVLALIFADGSLLKKVSLELQSDREIVRAALMTYADALQYAAKHLQADKDLQRMAHNRAQEESRLIKMLEAKCGPAVTSCVSRPRMRLW